MANTGIDVRVVAHQTGLPTMAHTINSTFGSYPVKMKTKELLERGKMRKREVLGKSLDKESADKIKEYVENTFSPTAREWDIINEIRGDYDPLY